jgi:vacuolar-type H+-ATPase subunit E/Vma4
MGHELGTIGEEATMAVMPALQMMVEQLRELIPVIGPQLKAAIESVDWKGLVTTFVNLATFLITNAEAIGAVVLAMFALNTMVKLVTIAIALQRVAIVLQTAVMAIFTTGVNTATVALKLFRTALITTGIGAVLVALGFLADWMFGGADATDTATDSSDKYADSLGQTADGMDRIRDRAKDAFDFDFPDIPTLPGSPTDADDAAEKAAEAARKAAEEAQRAEEQRLEKRRAAYQSFADSVKSIFGQIKNSILSSFNLPTLGNSVNAITRNISKLLEKTKSFAKNITQLSGLGLNSALLQQVIQAGPIQGSQLASAIVSGGGAFISQLNAAYGEFGNLASGIAGVGTRSEFANQEVVNNYYQIEVSGGVGSGPTIGKAIVDAIKSYERTSGAVWQGA